MSAREQLQARRAATGEIDRAAGRRADRARRSEAATAFALGAKDDAGTAGAAAAATGAAAATSRAIQVFPISLPGSTRDAATDITRADAIWSQCSLSVTQAGGESWDTDVMDLLDPKGVLNEYSNPNSPTIEETTMLAHHPGGAAIHAYYVPSMSAGSRGESFGPSWTPSYPAVVISDAAASDSLAHELGHVLLDDVSHDSDPDNLMASGSIRNVGVDKLTPAQCARI